VAGRLSAWVDGFALRHGTPSYEVDPTGLMMRAPDGTQARLLVPFPPLQAGPAGAPRPDPVDLVRAHLAQPRRFGLVLVRRGGWAVGAAGAAGDGVTLHATAHGTRYVQARTAAGGWSQQRYARRRAGQVDALLDEVARAVGQILLAPGSGASAGNVDPVVTGGDRLLLRRLLGRAELSALTGRVVERVLDVPDPRLRVLEGAAGRATACLVRIGAQPPSPTLSTT